MRFVNNMCKLFLSVLYLNFIVLLSSGCHESSRTYYEESEEIAEQETTSQRTEPLEFHGYTCTDDCSGHQAGYDWAEENNITDVSKCNGNSRSFDEGCQAYLEENGYY